jgi:RNA polymerase sigma factor (sigma-70 family)
MDNQGRSQVASTITDETLISRCLEGHQKAWELLLKRYEKLIYYTAFQTGMNAVEVDDVFQNVCAIWFRQLKQLRDLHSMGSWLITTTRRECWAQWKKDAASEDELNDQIAYEESPEMLASQAEDSNIIRLAFRQLGNPCHRILNLLYFDTAHHSYTEVAREVGIPVNSLGPTRARCLEKLELILKKFGW